VYFASSNVADNFNSAHLAKPNAQDHRSGLLVHGQTIADLRYWGVKLITVLTVPSAGRVSITSITPM
jgi:hypothetical protein